MIDVLDFVDQVFGQSFNVYYIQNVVWYYGIVEQWIVFMDKIVFLNDEVMVFGNEIFFWFLCFVGWVDDNVVFGFVVFVEFYLIVDIGDDCEIFWMVGFEQFGYVWQIFGNVVGFRCFMWDMCDDVFGFDFLIVFNGQNGIN